MNYNAKYYPNDLLDRNSLRGGVFALINLSYT